MKRANANANTHTPSALILALGFASSLSDRMPTHQLRALSLRVFSAPGTSIQLS